MPVHAKSVLSPIPSDPALYTLLTDRENNCYTLTSTGVASTTGFADYSSYWSSVDAAIQAHFAAPRPWIGDFVPALYSYVVTSGITPPPSTHGAAAMGLGAVRAAVSATTVSYYNDLPYPAAPVVPPAKPPVPANLVALEASITQAITDEEAHFRGLISSMSAFVQGFVNKALFEDVVVPTSYTKPQLGNYIYGSATSTELGYKAALPNFPGVSLTPPAYVP